MSARGSRTPEQWRRYLSTLTPHERFDAQWSHDEASGCMVWTGHASYGGYGRFMVARINYQAHRYAYERWKGPIPEGLQLDHLCRNRRCINPEHLEPVTRKENILRGVSPSAAHARQTHCKHGHEFTPQNTYTRPNGGRVCIACSRARDHRRNWKTAPGQKRGALRGEPR